MSATIDQRIVEMRFDNKQFEENVQSTIKALGKLDDSMSVKNSSRFTDALSNIENSLANLEYRFSAVGSVIHNVLESLITTGLNFAKSMTLDQATVGLSKYEQKLNAVRTIMTATGKSSDTVEQVMERLMSYSDQTSYNFSEMAGFIGNFTSAGIGLEVSEKAVEGIANACASAGINAREANRAMSAFSKAMSSGKMELKQWTSLELMNFTTTDFKKKAIEAGIKAGTLVRDSAGKVWTKGSKGKKKTEVTDVNIRDTLSKGWMTKEVMELALSSYYWDFENPEEDLNEFGKAAFEAGQKARSLTDALEAVKDASSSGWMKTWQLIFGDVEQAEDLFTGLADALIGVVNAIDEYRNRILEIWALPEIPEEYWGFSNLDRWQQDKSKFLSGRDRIINAFKNIWSASGEITKSIIDGWHEAFGFVDDEDAIKKIGAWLNKASATIEQGSKKLLGWLNEGTRFTPLEAIKQFVTGIVSLGRQAANVIGKVIRPIFDGLSIVLAPDNNLIQGIAELGSMFSVLSDWLAESGIADALHDIFETLSLFAGDVLNDAFGWIRKLINQISLSPKVGNWLKKLGNSLKDFAKKLPKQLFKLKNDPLGTIVDWLTKGWNKLKTIGMNVWNKIKGWLSSFRGWISELFSGKVGGAESEFGFKEIQKPGWLNAILSVVNWLQQAWNTIKTKAKGVWDSISGWFNNLITWVKDLFKGEDAGSGSSSGSGGSEGSWLIGKITAVSGWLQEAYDTVKAEVERVWGSIVEWFNGVVRKIKALFSKDNSDQSEFSPTSNGQLTAEKTPWYAKIIQSVGSWISSTYYSAKATVERVWGSIVTWFDGVVRKIKALFSKDNSDQSEFSPTSNGQLAAEKAPWYARIIQSVGSWISSTYNSAKIVVDRVWGSIVEWFNGVVRKIKNLFNKDNSDQSEFSPTSNGQLPAEKTPWYAKIIQSVGSWISSTYNSAKIVVDRVWGSIVEWFNGVVRKIKNLFNKDNSDQSEFSPTSNGQLPAEKTPWYAKIIQSVGSWISLAYDSVKRTIDTVWPGIVEWFNGVVSEVAKVFNGNDEGSAEAKAASESTEEPWYIKTIKFIGGLIQEVGDLISEYWQKAWTTIVNFFDNQVTPWLGTITTNEKTGKTGLSGLFANIGDALGRFAEWCIGFWENHPGLQAAWDGIKGIFNDIFNWIASLGARKETAPGGGNQTALSEITKQGDKIQKEAEPAITLGTILQDIGTRLSEAYKGLSELTLDDIFAALNRVWWILAKFAAIGVVYNLTSIGKKGKTFGTEILNIAKAIALVVAAVAGLALLPEDQVDRALKTVQRIMQDLVELFTGKDALGLLFGLIRQGAGITPSAGGGFLDKLKGIAMTIFFIGAGLAGVAYAIKEFSKMSPEDFLAGGDKAATIAVVLSVLILAIEEVQQLIQDHSKSGKLTNLKGFAITFGIMSLSLLAIAASLKMLETMDEADLQKGSSALSKMTMIMSLCILAFETVANSESGAKAVKLMPFAATFGIMSLSLLAMAGALLMLKDIDADQLSSETGALSILSAVVAGIVDIFGSMSLGALAKAAAGIAIVGGALALVADFMSLSFKDVSENLDVATTYFRAMDENLEGVSFDNIKAMGGAAAQLSADMATVTTNIGLFTNFDDFMRYMWQLSNRMKWFKEAQLSLDSEGHTSFKNLGDDIVYVAGLFTEAETMQNLSGLVLILDQVSGAMTLYSTAASELFDEAGNLTKSANPEAIGQIFEAIVEGVKSSDFLSMVGGIEIDDGTAGNLFRFATAMGSLAAGLKAYATGISGTTKTDLDLAKDRFPSRARWHSQL